MTVSPVTEQYPLRIAESKTMRSPGLHVSNIVKHMAIKHGHLDQRWIEPGDVGLIDIRDITDPDALLRINIGLAWEAHYVPMLVEVDPWPGELQVEGIYMTPDGESLSTVIQGGYRRVCHECKATYKSINTVGDFSSQWMWMAQVMAYCKGMKVTLAHVHVLYICGDYSYPIHPVREVYEIEFTPRELDINWRALVNYAKEYAREARNGSR